MNKSGRNVHVQRPSTATKTSAKSSAGWQCVGINVIHQPGVLSLCHNTSSKEKTAMIQASSTKTLKQRRRRPRKEETGIQKKTRLEGALETSVRKEEFLLAAFIKP